MSGLIPQHFIDELVTRVDIVDVINPRVPLKKKGSEFAACCPFHDEKTPSFYVSPQKQFYHCFGCGAHGTAIGFLMEFDHMEFPEAVQELADLVGLEVPREQGSGTGVATPRNERKPLYELMDKARDWYRDNLKHAPEAIDYLKRRGLSGETAAEFGIGYAPQGWDGLMKYLGRDRETREALARAGMLIEKGPDRYYDRFRGRVMFPIRDGRGRTIAFGGRVLGDGEPKYLNSPETPLFHKGRELYGLYEARQALREIPRLLVVEGYMDVVALAQAGIRNAVATLGTATTRDHLERLFRLTEDVVFCFDGDRAGRQAAWRALENALPAVRDGRQIAFLFLPEGEDPDSLVNAQGAEAFSRLVDEAMPLSDFLIQQLRRDTDLGTVDGRARLVDAARPHIRRIPDPVYRQLLVDRLSRLVRMPAERLSMLVEDDRAPATVGKRPSRAGAPEMTPVRKAVALLLHQPDLAQRVSNPEALAELDLRGANVLSDLIRDVQARPGVTTAGLLEAWRDRPEHAGLEKLAAVRGDDLYSVPWERLDLQHEFDGLIQSMERQALEERWQALEARLEGKRPSEMSEAERAERRDLLAALRRFEAVSGG